MVQRAQIDPAIHARLKATYAWTPPARRDGRGRPFIFRPDFLEQAFNFALLGCTDEELARLFSVPRETINDWYRTKPGFREAVLAGKDEADSKVARALFMRATGYTITETQLAWDREAGKMVAVETQRHIPPDTTAATTWLRLRQREKWADAPEDANNPESTTIVFRPVAVRTIHVREPTQPPLTIDAVADDDSE
jgi:hypothetical protein